ncbi:hypothetical protein [Chryseobacterium hagamense]|uniref:Uncharacterized protein n=1 Tax=Chryseobacterium hagamense TaxID=395935 RepID=A0A511YR00_9FLAO|nr:hypothetical protein [Chryseobacterium hagamense]GEN77619.1 hypothetical protein CHA01nite_33590 [Chryseobacterium hagamense]
MKSLLVLLFPVYLFSQENCFDDGQKHYSAKGKLSHYTQMTEFILLNNPKHIKYKENRANLSYEEDERMDEYSGMPYEQRMSEDYKRFEIFYKYFNHQFHYIRLQKAGKSLYAVAENQFGHWLLEIKGRKPKAYYIGFSKNTYVNRRQKNGFIRNNTLFLDGSFISIKKGIRFDEWTAVKDFLTFEISLDDIKKDSDGDGYNDLFEHLIFLNSDSRDTDGDGISDFEDLNPLHASERNRFTELFESIIESDLGENEDATRDYYSFKIYESDCNFFQRIHPKDTRILVLSGSQAYQLENNSRSSPFGTFYGRIKKGPDETTFYIPYFKSSSGGRIIAEYKDGKWSVLEDQEYKT